MRAGFAPDLLGNGTQPLLPPLSLYFVTFWHWIIVADAHHNWQVGGLGAISIIVLMHPKLQGPRWRTLRLLTFVCTGLGGIVPFVHGGIRFGFTQMALQSGLPYYMTEGVLFLMSAAIYGVS